MLTSRKTRLLTLKIFPHILIKICVSRSNEINNLVMRISCFAKKLVDVYFEHSVKNNACFVWICIHTLFVSNYLLFGSTFTLSWSIYSIFCNWKAYVNVWTLWKVATFHSKSNMRYTPKHNASCFTYCNRIYIFCYIVSLIECTYALSVRHFIVSRGCNFIMRVILRTDLTLC